MRCLPYALLPLALAWPPAFAQQPVPAPLQTVQVQGQAGAYDARRDDTATKLVVTREEILKHGDTTLGDVLKRLPGVTLGGVQGRGGDVRMRGLGAGYTQVLLNGEPAPAGFSLDQLSPDLVERIEIMRAATAETSTQAIAGAINIVLKKTVQAGQKELKLGALDESGYPGANATLQLSDRAGKLSYTLAGTLNASRYMRPGGTFASARDASGTPLYERQSAYGSRARNESLSLAPRLNWAIAPGDTLSSQSVLSASRFRARNVEGIATLFGEPPRFPVTGVEIDSSATIARTDLAWTRKLAEGAKMDMKAGANYNHRDTVAPSWNDDVLGRRAIDRLITSVTTDRGYTASGKYATPVLEGHTLAFGWDGAYVMRDEDRIQRETSRTGETVENLDQVFTATVRRLALFAQDEWTVTPRWSVYAGLRWEGLDTRSVGLAMDPVHHRSSVWSPLLQTLWKLPDTKNDQLRLALTRTYKAPETARLIPRRFASNNNSRINPDLQGNPELRPELAWGLDLGYEHYLEGGGMLGASGYVRRIEDYTRNDIVLRNHRWVQLPINDGGATTRGIELEAKLALKSLMKNAPAIDLRANLARNWSSVANVPGPDNRLDGQTPVSGNLGMDWKAQALPLTLGGSLGYQGGGPVRVTRTLYGWTAPKRTLDVYGLWKFDPRTQLRVSLANALHQDNVADTAIVDAGLLYERTVTPTAAVLRVLLETKL